MNGVYNGYFRRYDGHQWRVVYCARDVQANSKKHAAMRCVDGLLFDDMDSIDAVGHRHLLGLKAHLNGAGACPFGIKLEVVQAAYGPGRACVS